MGAEMKFKILALLRESKGYVSGQDLCESFGVSRTAVWKAVKLLRKAGYEIEAVQNKGYRLISQPEILSREELLSKMTTEWAGKEVVYAEKTGSTNLDAKRLAETGAVHGTLAVADRQEMGRGRRGRSWESPSGVNVYFTLLLRPDFTPEQAAMLTLVMALSAAQAVEAETGCRAGIKWPNDLVLSGKKICGILTELTMEEGYVQSVIIGVGINVGKQEFPEKLSQKATSILAETGKSPSRADLIVRTMERFEENYQIFAQDMDLHRLKEAYETYLVNKEKEVRVLDPKGEFTGRALGINNQGELLVETAGGDVQIVYAGEVSVRGIYGYV